MLILFCMSSLCQRTATLGKKPKCKQMNTCMQLATSEKTKNKNIPNNNLYTWLLM